MVVLVDAGISLVMVIFLVILVHDDLKLKNKILIIFIYIMDFLDEDFHSINLNKNEYQNNFEDSHSCVARRFLMTDTLSYLFHVKNKIR